jgi:hypothetical protein
VPVPLSPTSRVRRRVAIILAAVLLAAVAIIVTGPPRPLQTTAAQSAPPNTVRGAYHIHTTRSDGALDKDAVAASAARAGLQFAIFTDHGDATRTPDPPAYLHGVLCIDAVEISTNGGHYVALGIPASPYPLAGEADDVAEDVARLGGFGIAAHPSSARRELAWSDWAIPMDGIEWLNADSEWRDETRLRLTRALLDYVWRPAGALASLLDRPIDALNHWDTLARERRVVALAGHDAHGGLGPEDDAHGRRVHIPAYEATFRTFSNYVTLPRGLTSNAAEDAVMLIAAIREGSVFTVIDALAGPATLDFSADVGGTTVRPGQAIVANAGPARFTVRAAVPPGAVTLLLHDGRAIVEQRGGAIDRVAALPGVYRVEIHLPRAPGVPPVPWIVSNPIYRRQAGADVESAPSPPETTPITPLGQNPWRAEVSPGSVGTVKADAQSATMHFALRPGAKVSQFVALVNDIADVPGAADGIAFRGVGSRPMRVSVQLRFAQDGGARWGRSIYLDQHERDVVIPLSRLKPADSAGTIPALSRTTSVLFVIDLVNAAPGAEGSFTIRDARFARIVR